MKYANFFFDFDGVILESVNIKSDAFYKMYLPYGKNIAEKVIQHHLMNGGISRFKKFKYYHKTFLNTDLTYEELNHLSSKFRESILTQVLKAPFIPGIEEFLQKYYTTKKMWVISATPHDEINTIVRERKLEKYFIEVFGSPAAKKNLVKQTIDTNNLISDHSVFIGDAWEDYIAAKENGIQFVLRSTNETQELFNGVSGIKRIKDFSEFEQVLNSGKHSEGYISCKLKS